MHTPFHPRRPPTDCPSQYLGTDPGGHPVYGTPATPPVAPLEPIKVHPWGAYLGGGCLAVLALGFLGVIAMFLLLGLAAVALAVALSAVALTICVVVLRSVLRDYQQDREDY